jgi:hypothetical protein
MNLFDLSAAERELVLEAFMKARASRRNTADCYAAAIGALRQRYPGVAKDLVATQAIRVLSTEPRLVDVARERS